MCIYYIKTINKQTTEQNFQSELIKASRHREQQKKNTVFFLFAVQNKQKWKCGC